MKKELTINKILSAAGIGMHKLSDWIWELVLRYRLTTMSVTEYSFKLGK